MQQERTGGDIQAALDEMLIEFSPTALSSDGQRAMLTFWQQARGEDLQPPVKQIDPLSMPRISLPSIILTEPVEGNDFYIRVMGTSARDAIGKEFTGLTVRQIPGTEAALHRFAWCQENVRPYFAKGPLIWADKRYKSYTVLALPFGTGRSVERIMLVYDFLEKANDRPDQA